MAITGYCGLPGHGKSYGAVEHVIIPALKANRLVYTNIPMHDEKCLNDFGMAVIPFKIDDIIKNSNWWIDVFTAGAVLVLDECWRLWPAGLKANQVRESDKTFLAEHRHNVGDNGMSTEIYLVTQNFSQVSSFARELVETSFRMVKLSAVGLDKRFRVDVYQGAVTGPNPPASKRIREIHGGKYDESVYQYYKSHTKSETGEAGNETKTDKRGNALFRTSIKFGIAFILISPIFIYYGFKKVAEFYAPAADSVQLSHSNDSPDLAPVISPDKNNKPSRKPEKAPFLSAAKSVFVSYSLGSTSDYYYFSVDFDNGLVHLSVSDLKKLGYKILRINDCLSLIKGYDFDGHAVCSKRVNNPSGFSERFASDPIDTLR